MVRWTAAVKPHSGGHHVTIWEVKPYEKMLGYRYIIGSDGPVSALRAAVKGIGMMKMEITHQTDPVGESVWVKGIAEWA